MLAFVHIMAYPFHFPRLHCFLVSYILSDDFNHNIPNYRRPVTTTSHYCRFTTTSPEIDYQRNLVNHRRRYTFLIPHFSFSFSLWYDLDKNSNCNNFGFLESRLSLPFSFMFMAIAAHHTTERSLCSRIL